MATLSRNATHSVVLGKQPFLLTSRQTLLVRVADNTRLFREVEFLLFLP